MVTININGKEVKLDESLLQDMLHAYIMSSKYMQLDNAGDDIINELVDALD